MSIPDLSRTCELAYSYVDRGWALIPVHPGSKVPIERDWPARLARTRGEVDAMLARWDGCNLGLATGVASGVWVLDIDPQSGGDVKVAGLVAAYGRLPETYTVRTPSGGLHYYFRMPDDFEPRNHQHGSGGKLPIGIDVRGWHGQVVVPPSRRADGDYVTLVNVEAVRAPGWLLEMIQPERREPKAKAAGGPEWVPTDVQIDDSRVQAWLAVVVPARLGEFMTARPGTRNDIGFDSACRLIELINAGWVDHDSIYQQFQAAGEAADVDGEFPEREREQIWTSARRQVGTKAAVLPDVSYMGSLIPFAEFGGAASDFSSTGTEGAGPGMGIPSFVDPGDEDAPASEVVPDPMEAARERAVQAEMSRLWLREEAARRLREHQNPTPDIVFLDEDEQDKQEPPEPLVEGWLWRGHITRLYGAPGHGKSFVAVDFACCVSTGMSWHEHRVKHGKVLYVAAEDSIGIILRLRAWRQRHERAHGVTVMPLAITLDQAGAERFKKAILSRFEPGELALIVLDTQAMVTVGMDEDRATEMGEFAAAIKKLCADLGVTVLIVHHSGHGATRARGSSAMLGAVNTEMRAVLTGSTVELTGEKQKNTPRPDLMTLGLSSFNLDGVVDTLGNPVSSAVLVKGGDPGTVGEGLGPASGGQRRESKLRRHARLIVQVMREIYGVGEGGSRDKIQNAWMTEPEIRNDPNKLDSKRKAFDRAWGLLEGVHRIGDNPTKASLHGFMEFPELDDLDPNPDYMQEHGHPHFKARN